MQARRGRSTPEQDAAEEDAGALKKAKGVQKPRQPKDATAQAVCVKAVERESGGLRGRQLGQTDVAGQFTYFFIKWRCAAGELLGCNCYGADAAVLCGCVLSGRIFPDLWVGVDFR